MEEDTEKKNEAKTDFSTILQILAVVCLAAGVLMALKELTDYRHTNELMAAAYAVAGVFSGAFWWALAVIVKAAAKYLKADN